MTDSHEAGPTKMRTPMYEAFHAAQYQRQELIRKIEAETSRTLVCYVSGPASAVDRDDIIGLVELLHNVPQDTNVDLLLHTGGGDIDAAEKFVSLLRRTVGTGELRVVVPDFAKSAGTLIALGADAIIMSDSSELGPIDPQIVLGDGNGNLIRHSVQNYLDAYAQWSAALAKDPANLTAQLMLAKLDPARLTLFESVKLRAQQLAENHLKRGMFQKQPGPWTAIPVKLLDTKTYPAHGQMIDYEAAQQLELVVTYLPPTNEVWRMYWKLYCQQRLAVQDKQKLFESNFASLPMESTTRQ